MVKAFYMYIPSLQLRVCTKWSKKMEKLNRLAWVRYLEIKTYALWIWNIYNSCHYAMFLGGLWISTRYVKIVCLWQEFDCMIPSVLNWLLIGRNDWPKFSQIPNKCQEPNNQWRTIWYTHFFLKKIFKAWEDEVYIFQGVVKRSMASKLFCLWNNQKYLSDVSCVGIVKYFKYEVKCSYKELKRMVLKCHIVLHF